MPQHLFVLHDSGKGKPVGGERGRIESALPGERVDPTCRQIDRSLVLGRTTRTRADGDSAGREEELSSRGAVVGCPVEDAECCASRLQHAEELEAETDVQGNAAAQLPGVLRKPFDLFITRVVDLLLVVLSIAVEVAGQRVRERVSGIERIAEVGSEVVGARGVVGGVHADIALGSFQVEAGLHRVRSPDPRDAVGEVVGVLCSIERPTAVEAESR